MTYDADDDLRRLFAGAEPLPPDEAFVRRVSARIARARRVRLMLLMAVAVPAVISAAIVAPPVVAAFEYLQQLPLHIAEPMTRALVSPAGLVVSAVVGGLIVFRSLTNAPA